MSEGAGRSAERVIIARFSALRSTLVLVPGFAIVIMIFVYPLYADHGDVRLFIQTHAVWCVPIAVGSVAGIYFLWLLASLFYRLLFDHRAAIWTEGAYVVYLQRAVIRVPVAEIADIELGKFSSPGISMQTISIVMQSGGRKQIATYLLDEPTRDVVDRLSSLDRGRKPAR